MNEKRKYTRYPCKIKIKFEHFEGNPDEFDINTAKSKKATGVALDISNGGLFIVTGERVIPNMPLIASFKAGKKKYKISSRIVRTGLLKNNPSEMAQKFSEYASIGDSYIAIQFDEPIPVAPDDFNT